MSIGPTPEIMPAKQVRIIRKKHRLAWSTNKFETKTVVFSPGKKNKCQVSLVTSRRRVPRLNGETSQPEPSANPLLSTTARLRHLLLAQGA